MSTEEHYARAASSSHLKMTDRPGDADIIAAAGWADSLGTVLLRCRSEWDGQRAQLEQAQRNRIDALAAAQAMRKGARKTEDPEQAARDADELARAAEVDLNSSRRLIRLSMQSVETAFVALRALALMRIGRRRMGLGLDEADRCVHAALDVWLDRRCDACCGRGQNGGYGAPVMICRRCIMGERRRVFPAKTVTEYGLGEWLLAEIDRRSTDAQRVIRERR